MRAELKGLHSPDVQNLEDFRPNGPFGILVQASVGPAGLPGEESFDFMLCTPDWFSANMRDTIVSGRHFLFVQEYGYDALLQFVSDFCRSCEGADWRSVGQKVGRLGRWEFEDYVP